MMSFPNDKMAITTTHNIYIFRLQTTGFAGYVHASFSNQEIEVVRYRGIRKDDCIVEFEVVSQRFQVNLS